MALAERQAIDAEGSACNDREGNLVTVRLFPDERAALKELAEQQERSGLAAVRAEYAAALERAPVSDETRRTYASKVRQYLAWLAATADLNWTGRTGCRPATTTTAHRPGSRRSNGSSLRDWSAR